MFHGIKSHMICIVFVLSVWYHKAVFSDLNLECCQTGILVQV